MQDVDGEGSLPYIEQQLRKAIAMTQAHGEGSETDPGCGENEEVPAMKLNPMIVESIGN